MSQKKVSQECEALEIVRLKQALSASKKLNQSLEKKLATGKRKYRQVQKEF